MSITIPGDAEKVDLEKIEWLSHLSNQLPDTPRAELEEMFVDFDPDLDIQMITVKDQETRADDPNAFVLKLVALDEQLQRAMEELEVCDFEVPFDRDKKPEDQEAILNSMRYLRALLCKDANKERLIDLANRYDVVTTIEGEVRGQLEDLSEEHRRRGEQAILLERLDIQSGVLHEISHDIMNQVEEVIEGSYRCT
ncbi:hypothetical protein ACFLZH_05395 [Patescibacteria group bacterium]